MYVGGQHSHDTPLTWVTGSQYTSRMIRENEEPQPNVEWLSDGGQLKLLKNGNTTTVDSMSSSSQRQLNVQSRNRGGNILNCALSLMVPMLSSNIDVGSGIPYTVLFSVEAKGKIGRGCFGLGTAPTILKLMVMITWTCLTDQPFPNKHRLASCCLCSSETRLYCEIKNQLVAILEYRMSNQFKCYCSPSSVLMRRGRNDEGSFHRRQDASTLSGYKHSLH